MTRAVPAKSARSRVVLWVVRYAASREILDVPVMVVGRTRSDDGAFAKITTALELLGARGGRSLDDIRRYTNGVLVWITAEARAEWDHDTRLVILDEADVYHEGTSPRDVASSLVHGATHARLDAKGFPYSPALRTRIERVCSRRQLAFARRLAEPADLADQLAATMSVKQNPGTNPIDANDP